MNNVALPITKMHLVLVLGEAVRIHVTLYFRSLVCSAHFLVYNCYIIL